MNTHTDRVVTGTAPKFRMDTILCTDTNCTKKATYRVADQHYHKVRVAQEGN